MRRMCCVFLLCLAGPGAAWAAPAPAPVYDYPRETVHYWVGPTRVDAHLALDELRVVRHAAHGLVAEEAVDFSRRARGTAVSATARSFSLADLEASAEAIVRPGREVCAVLYDVNDLTRQGTGGSPLPRRFSVQLREGVSLNSILRQLNLRVIEQRDLAPRLYILEANGRSLLAGIEAANALYEHGSAEFATPIIPMTMAPQAVTINDPLFAQSAYDYQWNLSNHGPVVRDAETGAPNPPPGDPTTTIFNPQAVAGNDLNVIPAWNMTTGQGQPINGQGVNIGIVDVGVHMSHEDLLTRISRTGDPRTGTPRLDHNYSTDTTVPADDATAPTRTRYDGQGQPYDYTNPHGTSVSGTAAASGNNVNPQTQQIEGMVGVAYGASLIPTRLFDGVNIDPNIAFNVTDLQISNCLGYLTATATPAADRIAVSSNSWAPRYDIPHARIDPIGPDTGLALQQGVTQGRGGRGTVYVLAAGNNWMQFDYAQNRWVPLGARTTYNGYASDRRVICVGATDSRGIKTFYSQPGCSLLVNAPSGYELNINQPSFQQGSFGCLLSLSWLGHHDIAPLFPNYGLAGGTSAATPQVSGVVALMLQANPDLTWRDVQHILVATADTGDSRLADPNPGPGLDLAADWFQNGAGRWYNPEYGFGRVDAARAVEVAQSWINVPGEEFTSHFWEPETPPEYKIYDPDGQTFYPLHVPLPIDDEDFYVEHVEAVVDIINHAPRGDLQIALVSPMDTWSVMHVPHDDANTGMIGVRFTTVEGWGEAAEGEWTLAVADGVDNGSSGGRIKDVEIRVYGFPVTSAPQVQDPSPHTTLASYPITVPCHLASGTAPVTWSLDSPPPDVTIDPLTGIVTWHSGDPDDQRTVTVRATNLTGSDTASLTMIRIQPE